MSETPSTLAGTLAKRRVLITCGTGGVGKTTVSASLGVKAALEGKRVVVITIDPAKRLATSLGLDKLGHEPTDLTAALAKAAGREVPGRFFALMPKSRESYERLIRSLTTNEEAVQRIFRNPILNTFSQDFSGANEYLALEELVHFHGRSEFDLVILDTPPSRNTLSFLEAPQLLARFFEEKMIRFLVMPANRLLAFGMRKAFSVLEKLTGTGFVNQLFDFGEALFEVQENFLKKLKAIHKLLQSEDIGFLLVAAPTPESAPEIGHFLDQIHGRGFHFDGVLLNRSLGHLQPSPGIRDEATKLIESLQARERAAYARLKESAERPSANEERKLFYVQLPELARDVHGLEDLYHVSTLFNGAP
ncbi:MAG: ArsA family ATPase [Bdellovibrionales bacterium]|nr:ArsA family ATPase [Bdellovibrionales bacterium]